jgi:hypothetical protein
MKCIIKEDSMGSLHIWKGHVTPTGHKYTWKAEGKWADLYVQDSESRAYILEYLKPAKRRELEKGYAVTAEIPSEYFPE